MHLRITLRFIFLRIVQLPRLYMDQLINKVIAEDEASAEQTDENETDQIINNEQF